MNGIFRRHAIQRYIVEEGCQQRIHHHLTDVEKAPLNPIEKNYLEEPVGSRPHHCCSSCITFPPLCEYC